MGLRKVKGRSQGHKILENIAQAITFNFHLVKLLLYLFQVSLPFRPYFYIRAKKVLFFLVTVFYVALLSSTNCLLRLV